MDSTIPYLLRLEADLELVAEDAAAPRKVMAGPGGPRRRRPAQVAWLRWSGAAAALLVVAWGIGSYSTGGLTDMGTAAPAGQATGAGSKAGEVQQPAVIPDGQVNGFVGHVPGTRSFDLGGAPSATPAPAAPGIDIAKIDRDGTLWIKLEQGSFKRSFNQVVAIAEANGGLLLTSETHGPDEGILTLRIPAARFDHVFAAVSDLGAVRDSSVTGKDVTSQYLDLQAHLKIAKGRRDVIAGLYAKATTISDTLRVYDELEQVQLRIDQIQGDLNYLDAQTSISTLKVTLSEREPEQAALQQGSGVENPSLTHAWDRAVQGFLGVIATVIVGLGYLVPLGILAALGLLIVMLARRRDRGAS